MKTKTITTHTLLLLIFLFHACHLHASATAEQRDTGPFTGVEVTSVFRVYVSQGDEYSVEVRAPEEHLEHIETVVEDHVLRIDYAERVRNLRNLEVHITAPRYVLLHAGGASSLTGVTEIRGSSLMLKLSGASKMDVTVNADELTTRVSGASDLIVDGLAAQHDLSVSGVSSVRGYNLETIATHVKSSGTAKVRVTATEAFTAEASGVSTVTVRGNPAASEVSTSGAATVRGASPAETGNLAPDIGEQDSVIVKIGDRREIVLAEGTRPTVRRAHPPSWANNWNGLWLGINGYFGGNGSLGLPSESRFMDLDYNKSLQVNLNFLGQNVVLARNDNSLFGLVSGMGVQWTNYHLSNDIVLHHGGDGLEHHASEHNLRTNRLRVFQLNVPLMLEYQHRKTYQSHSRFHASAGIQAGFRLRSHTKVEYRDADGDRQTDREREDFHLTPIRVEAIGKIGWSRINFFATYSLNGMFKDDRGPDLSPFSIGIRLIGG